MVSVQEGIVELLLGKVAITITDLTVKSLLEFDPLVVKIVLDFDSHGRSNHG